MNVQFVCAYFVDRCSHSLSVRLRQALANLGLIDDLDLNDEGEEAGVSVNQSKQTLA